MKKLLSITILLSALLLVLSSVFAQGMPASDDHTAREEAEGKEIWEKLQAKEVTCENLSDDNFGAFGEYFMGQMMGDAHEAMNNRLIQMMGEEGEEQMHVAMGKRMSGCDPDAPMPQNMPVLSPSTLLGMNSVEGMGGGMMPMMMSMMMGSTGTSAMSSVPNGSPQVGGGENPMMGTGWGNMMGGWNGFGLLGWIPMLLFWVLLILGVVALLRYLGGATRDGNKGRSPLEILKERYAKGEIDKKEFEQMKKDLI